MWLLVDPNEPLRLREMPVIKLDVRSSLSILPRWIQAGLRIPGDVFDYFFGVRDVVFRNLVANTEIVRRKALAVGEKAYF